MFFNCKFSFFFYEPEAKHVSSSRKIYGDVRVITGLGWVKKLKAKVFSKNIIIK